MDLEDPSSPRIRSEFRQAVTATPLCNVAFISAMEVSSGHEFADKALDVARQLDPSVFNLFQGREGMLEQLWALACSIEKRYFESTALQLGFGLCELGKPVEHSLDKTAALRKNAAITALFHKPVHQPKRARVEAQASSSSTPLLDKETKEKWRWAARLEAIGQRAGSEALRGSGCSSDSSCWSLVRFAPWLLIPKLLKGSKGGSVTRS